MDEFNKIVIVSLCDKWTKEIANSLSQSLDMVFCDTKDLIEYELIDRGALKKISTKEYLDDAERKVIKHISTFEDVTVAINYDYLVHNFDLLKQSSCVVFLMLSKTFVKENSDAINYLSYDKRTQELQKISNIVIPIRKTETNFVCLKIIEKLREEL